MLRKLVFVIGMSAALPAAAQPTTMVYQGTLTDLGGDPVTATAVPITFSIFATQTGGTALWSENVDVDVESGFFSIVLGETDALDESFFPANADRWLEVSIDGTPLPPRQPLGSAPWALVCGDAQSVGGIPAANLGDITGVTSPGATLTGGGLSGDVTLDVDYSVMGSCGDPTNDKVVGVNADGTVQCLPDLLGPPVPGDITAVSPGIGLTNGGTIGDVTLDLAIPVEAIHGGTGLLGSTGAQDTYLRSDGFGGWFESNLDGNNLILGTVSLDRLSPTGCATDEYARFDGLGWVCYPLLGNAIVNDTVSADKITLQAETAGGGGSLVVGDNYFFAVGPLGNGSTIAPATNGFCRVSVDVQIDSGGAPNATDDGPAFRIAINDGVNPDTDDFNYPGAGGGQGHVPGAMTEGAFNFYKEMSRTTIIPVSNGFNYSFGCFFGGVVAGDWEFDNMSCHVSYFCF